MEWNMQHYNIAHIKYNPCMFCGFITMMIWKTIKWNVGGPVKWEDKLNRTPVDRGTS